MSFVDLMKDDVFSDIDITNRTEAFVRSRFSRDAEGIINRKITAVILGQYVMTPEEQLELQEFSALTMEARQMGIEATLDNEKLKKALSYESTYRKLQEALAKPVSEDPDEAEAQMQEVTDLEAELDSFDTDTVNLVILRGRLTEPDLEPEAPVDVPQEETPIEEPPVGEEEPAEEVPPQEETDI